MNANEEIDLIEVLDLGQRAARILSRRKQLIATAVLGAAVLAAALSAFLPRSYESDGFYRLSMSNSEYGTTSHAFSDVDRFFVFIEGRNIFGPAEIAALKATIKEPKDLSELIEPVFSPPEKTPEGQVLVPGALIGLLLKGEGRTPEAAQRVLTALSDFLKNSYLYDVFYGYVTANDNKLQDALKTQENNSYDNEFALKQLELKKSDLVKIRETSSDVEVRQVLDRDKNSVRYMSPAAEVVTAQTAIADLRREQSKIARQQEITRLELGYFEKARELLVDPSLDGESLFQHMEDSKKRYFATSAVQRLPTAREADNEISLQLDDFNSRFFLSQDRIRFISGPTLPKWPSKPHAGWTVLGTALIVLLALCSYILATRWEEVSVASVSRKALRGELELEVGRK